MRGRNKHGQMLPLNAVDDFRQAAEIGQKGESCATAMFYAANAIFNYRHDVAQSIAIWQLIGARFPNAPEAEPRRILRRLRRSKPAATPRRPSGPTRRF